MSVHVWRGFKTHPPDQIQLPEWSEIAWIIDEFEK